MYVTNKTLHDDLNMRQVQNVIGEKNTKNFMKYFVYIQMFLYIQPLLEPPQHRRLKRKWPADLTKDLEDFSLEKNFTKPENLTIFRSHHINP